MLGRVGVIVVAVTLGVTGCAQSAPDGYTCVPRRPGGWCTFEARSRYQLVLAYPPGWKLAPVFMVMGQAMFELHHHRFSRSRSRDDFGRVCLTW